MKNRKKYNKIGILILPIILVVLTLFTLYIATNSGAKYVITDHFFIDLSNYYMYVIPPEITEFEEAPITTSFTVNNNDGTNYMTEDLVYTISVQENTKWDISASGELTRTISGGSIGYDTPSLTITPKSGAIMDWEETIIIILTVTSPYPDKKIITLTYTGGPVPTLSTSTDSLTYNASQLRVTSGIKNDSEIIINPNATQYGPYMPLDKGTYHITVTGTNLSNVNVDCAGSNGGIIYPISTISKTSTQIDYIVYIPDFNDVVEFRTFTNSTTAATVSQISALGVTGNNGWYSNNVTVTINKNTTEDSIQPQYQLETNGTIGEWTDYTSPFTIDIEGTTIVNIKNVATSPLIGEKAGVGTTIKIDKTPPNSFTPSIVSKTKTSITTNGVTGDQGGSGIANYYYSIDNGTTWIGSNSSGEYTFTGLTANTTYSIKQKAVDNAGNETMSGTLSVTTLAPYKVENITLTVQLANCGQFQQNSYGTDNSSGTVSATEVRATAGTSSFLQERNWTTIAGYKGTTLKSIVENHLNTNYPSWAIYDVAAKLTLQINIDFNSGNTKGEASCGTWITGQSETNNNLKTWNGGSSASNGDHNVATLRNIYSWNNSQTPSDFFISIYVKKEGTWTDARTIRYYPQGGNCYVTLEIAVSIPNPE